MQEKELDVLELIDKNKEELFYEIRDEIADDTITDIEWDGYNLWITRLGSGCFISIKELSDKFMDNLSIKLSNIMSVPFNRIHPILEANTESLRISIWHESRCKKKSMAIRKIPTKLRFNHETLVKSGYAPESIISILEASIVGRLSVVIGGTPHSGKTELLKYLATFIPADEKVGVYEDNQEIHYRVINPHSKCVEFFVDDNITYQDVIRAGLRHNIDWILLSESRGPEVLELMNSLSTGANCMTTMHLDDVRDMPDRMYSMLGKGGAQDRFINSIYKYIDLVVLVECDKFENRRIAQVGFLTRINGVNKCSVIYEDGEFTGVKIPDEIMEMFMKYGIDDPYNWRRD